MAKVEEAYKVLAAAIIVQAVKDYRKAQDVLDGRIKGNKDHAEIMQSDVRRFAKSSWIQTLYEICGNQEKLLKEEGIL
ncbi:MAG: hypothetical protein HUK24_02215 [Sphaerochaetaceae bacterium]|nr:hypothetical protein [Sphaerochaetaceae bacterium]MCF0262424.1 hypothetical protein [Sphaerochaetaceae bacterium]